MHSLNNQIHFNTSQESEEQFLCDIKSLEIYHMGQTSQANLIRQRIVCLTYAVYFHLGAVLKLPILTSLPPLVFH